MSNQIEADKIRCMGRRVSKPRLVHQTGNIEQLKFLSKETGLKPR